MRLKTIPSVALALATGLLLTGCGASSVPVLQTRTISLQPPAQLLAPVAQPDIPTRQTRDDERQLLLGLAQWGAQERAQLQALRDWYAKQAPK